MCVVWCGGGGGGGGGGVCVCVCVCVCFGRDEKDVEVCSACVYIILQDKQCCCDYPRISRKTQTLRVCCILLYLLPKVTKTTPRHTKNKTKRQKRRSMYCIVTTSITQTT